MSKLINIASSELGVTEISGESHNQRILEYAQESGFSWYKSDETSWCSVFLNWVAHKAGVDRSKDARAHSWTTVGKKVEHPLPGDVVLLSSNGTRVYHVGIFSGFSDHGRSVFVLGGNQSNKVSIAPFPLSHVYAYHRIDPMLEGRSDEPTQDPESHKEAKVEAKKTPVVPPKSHSPSPSTILADSTDSSSGSNLGNLTLPNVKVRYGQRGTPVQQIQEVLITLGFLQGPADGIFGANTAKAMQRVQFKGGIRPTGTYNRKTKDYLSKLIYRYR